MNQSEKPNSLTINQINDIRKGYQDLMKRNEETLQWMKMVGLIK